MKIAASLDYKARLCQASLPVGNRHESRAETHNQPLALVTSIGAVVRDLVCNIEEQGSRLVFAANYSVTLVHDLTSGASTTSSVKRG